MSECVIPQEYIEQAIGAYLVACTDGTKGRINVDIPQLHKLIKDAYVKGFESCRGQVKEIVERVEEKEDIRTHSGFASGLLNGNPNACPPPVTAEDGPIETKINNLAAAIQQVVLNQPEEVPYPEDEIASAPTCDSCGSNHWSNEPCFKPKTDGILLPKGLSQAESTARAQQETLDRHYARKTLERRP